MNVQIMTISEKVVNSFFYKTLLGNIVVLLGLILVVFVIIFAKDKYGSQFVYESRFYACPENGNSKCYKIKIGFGEQHCTEEYCNDALPNKLLFDNGGNVDITCKLTDKDKWHCYEINTGNPWNIQFAGTTKILK